MPKNDIPFLPGNTFVENVFKTNQKNDFRKPHSLGFINGYPVQPKPSLGIGLQTLAEPSMSEEELLMALNAGKMVYGDPRPITKPKFVPAHVAFDKVVLRFDAYFKQTVHESEEQYQLRRVRILVFLEDDSISVVEPPVENSGIPQGVLIKRQKLPKSSTEFYTARDFNLGVNITFYGKTFRIVNCDQFTRNYMEQTEGIKLQSPEEMPSDPYQESRQRPVRQTSMTSEKRDKLKRFLEKDRKVLRFYCVWDDRHSMFGEVREFVMHYHLVDDSIEVREVQKPNNGRDPFPILLRRQSLPKVFHELSDVYESEKRDCDDYTRRFYSDMYSQGQIDAPQASQPIPFELEGPPKPDNTLPPYNGYGSVEDSMGSCKYLVLKPPKKDFIKMLENEHKILRFVARMESKHKEDQDRRFVISYRLADDMMTIYEPPQRNAGIIGGKFMERTRVLRPGSSLSDPQGPSYYEIADLYIGAKLQVLSHHFLLIDADEYVFNYLESHGSKYKYSDVENVKAKVSHLLKSLSPQQKAVLAEQFRKADPKGTGVIERSALIQTVKSQFPNVLNEHEIVTYSRLLEKNVRKPNYTLLLE